MKLYLLKQVEVTGYDVYDSCVVVANDAEQAALWHPSGNKGVLGSGWATDIENVDVYYLGEAIGHLNEGVVCASFTLDIVMIQTTMSKCSTI